MEKVVINKFAQYAKDVLEISPIYDATKTRNYREIWEKYYGKPLTIKQK